MIRTQESTGKTVDEAFAKACALLGVQAEDENVSREVLEYPQKTGFLGLKTTPAKVRVSVEEPDAPAAAPAKPVEVVAEQPVETAAPVQETAPVAEEVPAAVAEPAAPAAEQPAEAAEEAEEVEEPIVIEENAKVKAAVARPWRACPIWQALWQTVWKAITSSWVWTLQVTATSARAT